MQSSQRISEIDILRGLAIIAMILIHTSYFFIANPLAHFVWNWSQFAVPAFIFCSSYLFFLKDALMSKKSFWSYIKKRFVRLLYPYYIFMIIFLILVFLHEPTKITPHYILQNIFVTGGIDINWLVLLFLEFTFLFPLLTYLSKKRTVLFLVFIFFSLAASIAFVFVKTPVNYKYIMWLPWAVIPLYSWWLVNYGKSRLSYITTLVLSCSIFFLFYGVETFIKHPLGMTDNKYPPNLFLISYGIFCICLLLYLLTFHFSLEGRAEQFLRFLSRHSYSLYFIHYSILYILTPYTKNFGSHWIVFFLIIFLPSLLLQYLFAFKTRR